MEIQIKLELLRKNMSNNNIHLKTIQECMNILVEFLKLIKSSHRLLIENPPVKS